MPNSSVLLMSSYTVPRFGEQGVLEFIELLRVRQLY